MPVETGLEDGTRVEVLGGLSRWRAVVTTGAAALRDGDPVTIAARRRRRAADRPPELRRPLTPPRAAAAASRLRRRDAHEHPAYRHQPPGHDVHAERRHRAARRDLAAAPAGRPDAGAAAAERHHPRRLPGRRPARDGGIDHPAARAGGQRGRRPRADQRDVERRPERSSASTSPGAPTSTSPPTTSAAASTASAPACPRKPTRPSSSSSTRPPSRSCSSPSRATTTPSSCATSPRTRWRQRLERVPGVAAVNVNGGLRRQILRRAVAREDDGDGAVGRSHHQPADAPRTRTCRSARSTKATSPTCCAARASSPASTRSATSSC